MFRSCGLSYQYISEMATDCMWFPRNVEIWVTAYGFAMTSMDETIQADISGKQ